MNIPENGLKSIVALLPSLLAPTISPLFETEWYSVEVVVKRNSYDYPKNWNGLPHQPILY